MKLNKILSLRIILIFALINSSVYIAFNPQGFTILRIITAGSLLLSALVLVFFFLKSLKRKWQIPRYYKVIYSLLIIWSLIIIIRSISGSVEDMFTLFGHYLMAWTWLTPLAVIYGFDISNWIKNFNFLGLLLLFGIVIAVFSILLLNSKYTFGISEWLQLYPVLFLTFFYQSKRNKLIAIVSVVMFAIVSIINSQRINALLLMMSLTFFMVEYLQSRKVSFLKKVISGAIITLLLMVILIQVSGRVEDLKQNDEISTDTRTFLFLEFYDDMSAKDLIFGRGALGSYYSPYFEYTKENNLEGDSPIRKSIEVGYLEMILKGGYIMMFLQLLILIPAAYRGIFKSKNSIGRMSGYFIFMYIVIYTLSYYPVYSAEYILLWMAVGTAISPRATNTILIKDRIKY